MTKIILFFFIFHYCFILNAQKNYKFNHYTTDDGLPTNTIYAITEDKNGNIVCGTDNGLTFFDGNDFITLNVKDGLINPYIVSVMTDDKGVLWFINYNGKIQKFENNKITSTSIFSNQTNAFLYTSETLYLYTSQNRYANNAYFYIQINKKGQPIRKLSSRTDNAPKIAPPILVQDHKEIKIIKNFMVYDNKKIAIPGGISLLHKVIFRKNDVLLLDEKFLFIVDFTGRLLSKIQLPSALSEKVIYKHDFIVDKQNNCWLNIQNQGLFILKNNQWLAINENLGLNSIDYINFLYCDSQGKMWVATNEKGLFCIPSTTISYYQFPNENNYFNGFALSKDKTELFVSSKFCLYEYRNNALNFIKKTNSELKIENYRSLPVIYVQKPQRTKWDKNLNMLTVQGKYLIRYDTINCVAGIGLNAIKINNNQVKSNFNEKIKNVVLYKDEYYFNNSKEISVRNIDHKEIKIKRKLKLNIKGYIQDFIFIKDTLWIATEDKIYKAFLEKIVDSITTINGKSVVNVNKIKVVGDYVFLCSTTGLFMIKSNQNRVLNKYNFLPNNEVYNAEFLNNELFVATKNGLAKIATTAVFKPSQKPKLQLFYNNKVVGKIQSVSKEKAIKIDLKIQNFNPVQNQIIQYKTDNLNWINTQNKTLIFPSLSYGKHKLTVRVKDVNSEWTIKILPMHKAFPYYLQWWFIALVLLLATAILYMFYQNRIKKIRAKKQLEIETNNRVAELRQSALSAMMNPHFIFNSLNAIQYYVNSNQRDKSSEHLGKLSRLVRLFLSQASAPFISLEDEINRLKLYVELEKIRFNNFDFAVNIDANIDAKNIKIPNMIVQPFIENAVLHGVSHLTENDGNIDLNFQLNQHVLTIEIVDNGFGIDNKKQKNDTHISKGISIITERLEILQQSYPEKIFSIKQQKASSDKVRKGHSVIILVTILD